MIAAKGLLKAADVAAAVTLRRGVNGVAWAQTGETQQTDADLARLVQAVPTGIAGALSGAGICVCAAGAGRGSGGWASRGE